MMGIGAFSGMQTIPSQQEDVRIHSGRNPGCVQVEKEERHAIDVYMDLIYLIQQVVQRSQNDFLQNVQEDLDRYFEEADAIASDKNSHGWNVASLTLAGAVLGFLVPIVPHLDGVSPDVQQLFSALGGVDAVKEYCKVGSQVAEGAKPVFGKWQEAGLMPHEVDKEFLNNCRQLGQNAAQNAGQFVGQMNQSVLRIMEAHNRARVTS